MSKLIIISIIMLICAFSAYALDAENLYSYYTFDIGKTNSTTSNDSSINLNHAENRGARILQSGILGESNLYSGSNDTYASFPINESGNWSYTAWISQNQTGIYGVIADIGKDGSDWMHFLANNPPYNIRFSCRDNSGGQCNGSASASYTGSYAFRNLTWDLGAWIYNSTSKYITLCVNTNCTTTNFNIGNIEAFNVLLIGQPLNADYDFSGYIDTPALWNVTLSMQDITDLYNSGFGMDYPFCTPNWTCSGYGECNISDLRSCNQTTDLNSCGESYIGDYSEFAPISCDFCVPNWTCSEYGLCNMSNMRSCLNVTDLLSCGEAFNETLSDYDSNCTFINLSLDIFSPINNTLSSAQLIAIYGINKLSNCTLFVNGNPENTDILALGNGTMGAALIFEGLYKWKIQCADIFQSVMSGEYNYLYIPSSASNVTISENEGLNDIIFYGVIMAFACFILLLSVKYQSWIFMLFSGLIFFVVATLWDIGFLLRMVIGIFGAIISIFAVTNGE